MKVNAKITLVLACSMATMFALVSAASLLLARPAAATPQFAKDTGKACGDCHTNPSGGGALTPLGEKFKANGNKLPK